MRKRVIRSFPAVVASALALASGSARAQTGQVDTNPPLPNVMLLIDNSGSMEYMIDGNLPENDPVSGGGTNACNCTDQGPGNPPLCPGWSIANPTVPSSNRWNTVQIAMTGSLQGGFNCVAMPRTSTGTLAKEYQINGVPSYDVGYDLPFHRLVAEDKSSGTPVACVVAPSKLPGANGQGHGVGPTGDTFSTVTQATDFAPGGTPSVAARQYGKLPPINVACTTQGTKGAVPGFLQYGDGSITSMRDLMRFGLMMFDSDTDPSTGTTSGTYTFPNYGGVYTATAPAGTAPFQGMWTYFPNWTASPTGAGIPYYLNGLGPYGSGEPVACSNPAQVFGVGARNPGAPPWEGRLVGFPTQPDIPTQEGNNDQVSTVILASRPYGATPMAGMFVGAQNYFWNDPSGPQLTDNYVKGMCRNEYIILLTDGAPNEDLEITPSGTADCSAVPPSGQNTGQCPFPLPQTTAATLYANGNSTATQSSVKTYVIGFAVSSFQYANQNVDCSSFATNQANAAACNCTDHTLAAQQPYGPCCVLQCIARNGGTSSPYFADSPGQLQSALGAILADIAKNTTTRTVPAYSPVVNSLSTTNGTPVTNDSIYLASFNPSPGLPWSGDIQRQRYQCTFSGNTFTVPTPQITPANGDDFAQNLNSNSGSLARTYIAFQPALVNGAMDATTTIRPYALVSGGDGVGQYKAAVLSGGASAIDTTMPWQAMNVPVNGCPYSSNGSGTPSGSPRTLATTACATMLLDYAFAPPSNSFSGQPGDFTFVSRNGNAFGSIYHATPVVVGPPGSLIQDPGYVGFASTWASRKTMVYTATNDGLLHAFWADETTKENNEYWAMLLPLPMTGLYSSYPASNQFLLDGSPVVKDVVWDRGLSAGGNANNPTLADSDPTAWHTMLVAGYGPAQQGYYAVDVTNPSPAGMVSGANPPGDPPPVGPVFRWQLTKMPSTNMPLFGVHGGTPAITTLYMDPDGTGPREIGVAILPGGEDVVPSTQGKCQRWGSAVDSAPVNSYTARTNVRCWGNPSGNAAQAYTDVVVGRSVSIVRLDTGEILRVFARKNDYTAAAYGSDTLKTATGGSRYTDVSLDSPMVGTPIVYPSDVGTDTTRFWVTDADGTVWKFDVSSANPANWVGTLFLDTYNGTADTSATSWSDGEPAQVPPVLSLDPSGNVVLNIATGTTDQFDTTGVEYVYSITEKITQDSSGVGTLRAFVNWWLQPSAIDNAPGERVSGPMTVFNGTLYFSTFAAAPSGTQSCNAGTARLWGRDFVTPEDTACTTNPTGCNRAIGGLWELKDPSQPNSAPPTNVEPDIADPTLQGKVIPGVSIKATPACADLGTPGNDSYVAGASHSTPQNFTSGSYSLFTQVGAKGANGATTRQFETAVPTPTSPTLIDSWAAVLE